MNVDEQELGTRPVFLLNGSSYSRVFVSIRGFYLSEFAVPWRCEFPFDTVDE